MIHFDKLESQIDGLRDKFLNAKPFPHLAIDDFADAERLHQLMEKFPDPESAAINKSRDYMFAKNKFEKSNFRELSAEFSELYEDLVSDRFQRIIQGITGEPIFIDREFHGGGIHQGGKGSFLDMHADFNYHPLHNNWFRNINAIIYLNEGWQPDWAGQLEVRHGETGEKTLVEPLFNRCVIMFTRDHTLHGYDRINFPEGRYRRSVAIYGYTMVDEAEDAPRGARSTVWYPEDGSVLKRTVGRFWPVIVKAKNKLFGSGTAKNG